MQITDFCVVGVFSPCTSGTGRLFVLSDEELVLRGEIGVVDDLAMGVFFGLVSTKGGIDYFCPMYPPSIGTYFVIVWFFKLGRSILSCILYLLRLWSFFKSA